MVAVATSLGFKGTACFTASRKPVARRATLARVIRVSASTEEEAVPDVKELTFTSSPRAKTGFTENDSAGQTNIFAVEPKQYVQGSSQDNTDSDFNFAILGAVVATFLFGAGALVLLKDNIVGAEVEDGVYSTLSEYSAKFAAEVKPAPPLVEVVQE